MPSWLSLAIHRSAAVRRWLVFGLFSFALVISSGCPKSADPPVEKSAEKGVLGKQTLRLQNLIETEDLLLDLNPRLIAICRELESGLADPSADLPLDLAECQDVRGLAPGDPGQLLHADSHYPDFIQVAHWPLQESAQQGVHPWAPLQSLDATWETMKIGVVSGDFTDSKGPYFSLGH